MLKKKPLGSHECVTTIYTTHVLLRNLTFTTVVMVERLNFILSTKPFIQAATCMALHFAAEHVERVEKELLAEGQHFYDWQLSGMNTLLNNSMFLNAKPGEGKTLVFLGYLRLLALRKGIPYKVNVAYVPHSRRMLLTYELITRCHVDLVGLQRYSNSPAERDSKGASGPHQQQTGGWHCCLGRRPGK